MTLTDQDVLQLAQVVAQTREEELDCEGFLLLVAAFVEGASADQAASLEQHARLCACCAEELLAVRAAVEQTPEADGELVPSATEPPLDLPPANRVASGLTANATFLQPGPGTHFPCRKSC